MTRLFYKEGWTRTNLPNDVIFVFGSNTKGIHGAGAAKAALKYFGATYGDAVGMQGQSYAIPTKDDYLRRLSLGEIEQFVDRFKNFASFNKQWLFFVTPIGTGLAGYKHQDIAPMFSDAPENCILSQMWFDLVPHASYCFVDF